MHQQHHRHRRRRMAVAVDVGLDRQGEVAHQVEAVARTDDPRVHPGQGGAGQGLPVVEQIVGLPGGPIVEVVAERAVGLLVADDPELVVQGPVDDVELAVRHRREILQVAADRFVEDLPLAALEGRGGGLDGQPGGVDQGVVDVRPRVLVEHLGAAALEVHGDQGGGVAAAAVDQVQNLAAGVEADRAGGQGVLAPDPRELLPLLTALLEDGHAAVRRHQVAEADVVVEVGDEADVARVLLHHRHLAALDVQTVNVMRLRAALIDADQDLVRDAVADLLDPHLDAVDRGQVPGLAALQVDGVGAPVLVAADVLQVDDVPVGEGPEVAPDAAVGVVGHRPGRARIVGRTDPDVEHAVDRRQVADPGAVRAAAHGGLVGVAEQGLAGDQLRRAGRHLGGGLRGATRYQRGGQEREQERSDSGHGCLLCRPYRQDPLASTDEAGDLFVLRSGPRRRRRRPRRRGARTARPAGAARRIGSRSAAA